MRSAFMEYIPCHVWIFNMFLASWTWNCWQSSRMLTLVCGVHIPCLHNLATTNHPCRPQRLNLWPLKQEIFFGFSKNKSHWVKVNQKIQNYCKSYTLCSTARAQGLFFVAFSCQRECLDPSETVAPYRSKPPPFTDPNSRKKSDDRKTGQGSQKRVCPTSDVLPAPRPGEILMQVFWLNLNWICHCRAGPHSKLKFDIMQIFSSAWINYNKWT